MLASPTWAVVVSEGDPGGPFSGIPYAWQITLETDSDGATVASFVGGKSWAHPMNPGLGSFGLDAGWTHTSNWMYLILEEERTLRFELSPNAEVPDTGEGFWSGELVPAFTLWSGVDDEGMDEHFYTQGAVPAFVDAPGFAYLDSVDMGPGPYDGSSATLEVTLPAGEYTIAVGDHDETALTEQNRGYSFCVANPTDACPPPVFVPEPALALQLLTGAGVLLAAIRLRSPLA
ncbi:MAG: hypothetical protein OEP95_06045 [Myxococcales bacterium]|nr:hypothetical protein [Myxococcales bacterium]